MTTIGIIVTLILSLAAGTTAAGDVNPQWKYMNRGVFSERYGLHERLVLFVNSGGSCIKCSVIADAMQEELRKRNISTTYIVMLNRMVDSAGFTGREVVANPVFLRRSSIGRWIPEEYEDAWYYYNADSAMLAYYPLTAERSLELLLSLIDRDTRSESALWREELSVLDESAAVLVTPTFGPFVKGGILVAGSGSALRMSAFDVETGKRVWAGHFPDSLFSVALDSGGLLERDRSMFAPEIIAAEWQSDGSVVCIGHVVSRRYNPSMGRDMIGKRSFIATIDTTDNTPIFVKAPRDLNEVAKKTSITNAQMRYPLLITTQCRWDAKGDAVYNAYTIAVTNIGTGEVRQFAPLDSAYRILGIEDNLGQGLFCIVDDELWTAQPLSPFVRNEDGDEILLLSGDVYVDYYQKLHDMAKGSADFEGSAFQRHKKYTYQSVVSGLYTLGPSVIAVMLYEKEADGSTGNWMTVYDVDTKLQTARRKVDPGWTLQMDDDTVLRVELVKDRYALVRYSWR